MAFTRADLIDLASPPCHECGAAVQRVESGWHRGPDDHWRPGPWHMVCGRGHRVPIEPFA